jgi:hypothetical protein
MTEPIERSARGRAARGLARALLGLSLALGPSLSASAQEVDPPDVAVDAAPADAPVDPCQPPYADRDTACVLTQSADTYGYLEAGQFNVYRVDAPAPQPLKAELLDLAWDADLYLYDSSNQEWAESVQEDTTPEVVDLTLPKLQTYYLYVVADAGRPIDPSLPYHLRVSLGAPLTTLAVVDTPPVPPSEGHDGKLPPPLPPPAPNPPVVLPAANAPAMQAVVPPADATTDSVGSTATSSSASASSDSGSSSTNSARTQGGSDPRGGGSTQTQPNEPPSPRIAPPSPMRVEATGPDGARVSYSVSASDASSVDCAPGSDSTFPLGTTSVSCTATGPTGKQATASFSVTVVDTTPPRIKAEPIRLPGGPGALAYPTPPATDLVDPSPSVTCSPTSPATFSAGPNTVTCTATDKAGNTSKPPTSVPVIVDDSIPPIVNVTASPAPNSNGWNRSDVTVTATATDGAGGSGVKSIRQTVNGTSTIVPGTSASVTISAEGQASVSFTATDISGNTSSPRGVTLNIDKTPPILPVPGPIVKMVPEGASDLHVTYPVTVSDNLDKSPKLSCDHPSGSSFPIGQTTVTCNATDAAGNISTDQKFTVTVRERIILPPTCRIAKLMDFCDIP